MFSQTKSQGLKKHHRVWLLGLMLWSCGRLPPPPSDPATESEPTNGLDTLHASLAGCPNQPTVPLEPDNVINLQLGSIPQNLTGTVQPEQHLGYTFEAKEADLLNLETESPLCLWLYSPTNQHISIIEPLPHTGQYVLQVASVQGTQAVAITAKLEAGSETNPIDFSPSQAPSLFSIADFPKRTCGDPMPSRFPVTFYPVGISNSGNNLQQVKTQLCQDAYFDPTKGVIQIASFTTRQKAEDFAIFVSSQVAEAEVGTPKTFNTRP
jgi:hypothetical protein